MRRGNMNIEWEDLVPVLRNMEGAALLVVSSFIECPGRFTAEIANIDEQG
jgi:hypothetical protein